MSQHPSLEALAKDTRLANRKGAEQLVQVWKNCKKCDLYRTAGDFHVFFRGTLPCDLLFIGEAPGNDEARQGKPFIGSSGRLLNILLEESLELLAKTTGASKAATPQFKWNPRVAITNVVACRPLDAANKIVPPKNEHATKCAPRLVETLTLAAPKVGIIRLGATARTLTDASLAAWAAQTPGPHPPILDLWHPAYISRQGGRASPTYERWRDDFIAWIRIQLSKL